MAAAILMGCQPGEEASNRSESFEVKTASGIPMIFVPAGRFEMGSRDTHPDESPVHEVTLDAYLMDQFEVSHEQMTALQLPNPSHWQDDPRKPVEQIRWRDAKLFVMNAPWLKAFNPATTKLNPAGLAIMTPVDTVCPQKLNGNMLLERVVQAPYR